MYTYMYNEVLFYTTMHSILGSFENYFVKNIFFHVYYIYSLVIKN
jgi:hypothetical protein